MDGTRVAPTRRHRRPQSLAALFAELNRSHFGGRLGDYSVRRFPVTARLRIIERQPGAKNVMVRAPGTVTR